MAKRISELDVATSVSDADYIPCVQGGVTKRATRAALYPDDVPVDTSSRILDLTGDRVPAIPDDPAGVTYQNDSAWTSWTGRTSTSIAVAGGELTGTCTATGSSLYWGLSRASLSFAANRLIVFKLTTSFTGSVLLFSASGGTETNVKTIPMVAGVPQYIAHYNTLSGDRVFVAKQTGTTGDTMKLSVFYIGTGTYLSKLVDRAGVPWTNYGAVPVDGPFGKGLQFNGAQYLRAPGPMIGTTGTIAIKFKRGTGGPQQYIFANCTATATKGLSILFMIDNNLAIRYGDDSTYYTKNTKIITDNTDIHTLVLTFTATGGTATVDGVDYDYTASLTMTGPVEKAVLGAFTGAAQLFTGTIYALRADSRVWTDEEIARWSRDPYSEDSGLVDAFSLDFTNLPTFADNAAAIAGNLPAGKLYKTSTGNVLVRY